MEIIINALTQINWTFFAVAASFVVFDVFSGITKALYTKTLNSKKMKLGGWHKLGTLMAMLLAVGIDVSVNTGMAGQIQAPVFEGFAIFVVGTEIVSILENLSEINPELAKFKIFNTLRQNNADITNEEKEES